MDEKQRSKLGFAVAAFKSNTDRFNSSSTNCGHDGQHIFQEYTYKKITPCDVCREILRGHTRQGLKCKMCRVNVHSGDCQLRAAKCQVKVFVSMATISFNCVLILTAKIRIVEEAKIGVRN